MLDLERQELSQVTNLSSTNLRLISSSSIINVGKTSLILLVQLNSDLCRNAGIARNSRTRYLITKGGTKKIEPLMALGVNATSQVTMK